MILSKTCRRCKIDTPISELKKDLRNGDNYSSFCKKCHRQATKDWQKRNPDKVKATRKARYEVRKEIINERKRLKYDYEKSRWAGLKKLYKIDKEWYDNQMLKQNNGCAICSRKLGEFKGKLVIDHDHSCCEKTPTCGNCNRGILCHPCNISLYSVETINNWTTLAERYLNENSKNTKGN